MNFRKMKEVSKWLRSTVFREEPIRPKAAQPSERASVPAPVPAPIRAARVLESEASQNWQSRESIFMKEARLLERYTDDYDYCGSVRQYYPTYQSLSDQELRGYFTWRTKLRRGDIGRTSLSFAFLYIYELINQVGVADPMDGYNRLRDFRDAYGGLDEAVLPYLTQWLADYVIYYDLDPSLLPVLCQTARERSISVLERIQEHDEAEIMAAVKQLAPSWLSCSRFYASHPEDMDAVTVRVLRRMSAHYSARYKRSMVDRYCGGRIWRHARPFSAAVFCDPLHRKNYEYAVDGQCLYRCEDGRWTALQREDAPQSTARLTALTKAIDAVMRQTFGDAHPIKTGLDTKWILGIIEEEAQARLAKNRAAEAAKVSIDFGQLSKIRRDAAATQEKLIVEEEMDGPEPPCAAEQAPPAPPPEPGGQAGTQSLDPAELRLLRCLLYGGELDWVREEGRLLSVLADGVNEKLYDTFQDAVLDGAPQVIEDYISDLKEMVGP